MKQIEEYFKWQIRKTVDGKLMECDIYIDVVEPKTVSAFQTYIHQPYIDNPMEHLEKGATTDDVLEVTKRNEERMRMVEADVTARLEEKLTTVWSKKNKDMTVQELIEIFKNYPVVFNKFLVKWHEVCMSQTFRGLELDKNN